MSTKESKLKEYFDSIKEFSDYPSGERYCAYEFSKLPCLGEVFKGFDIRSIAREGNTFDKARNVMRWVEDSTSYDGGSPLGPALADKIIEFGIVEKNPINCANRSILFCDALVSLGIFAMPVNLQHRSFLPQKGVLAGSCHCHVIAQVWLPEENHWAAFDPSFGTYFTDNSGEKINISEMLILEHHQEKILSVDNKTGKETQNGSLCTRIGLFELSIFPGNGYQYRYDWNQQLILAPESYIDVVKRTADDEGWNPWRNRLINNKKINIEALAGEPVWVD